MKNEFALRIYKNENELKTVLTTRLGLDIDETTLEVKSDLSIHAGLKYVLYNITTQKEVRSGVIEIMKERIASLKEEKKLAPSEAEVVKDGNE